MCKCKLFTLTRDLHVVYMAIDTYMHNIGLYMGYNPWKMFEQKYKTHFGSHLAWVPLFSHNPPPRALTYT